MSHEICKSIGKPYQTADGKWTAQITSAVNNVRPLTYRKITFIPQESRRDLVAVILQDLIDGNIHMIGKSPYQTFVDELEHGITSAEGWTQLKHFWGLKDRIWSIYAAHNFWHGQECKPSKDEQYRRMHQKLYARKEQATRNLADAFAQWKADKRRFYLTINGNEIVSFKHTSRGSRWHFRQPWDKTTARKEFSAVEVAKIRRWLGDRHLVVEEPIYGSGEKCA